MKSFKDFLNRKYYPFYNEISDYNTNGLSYYDYLARINEFIKKLAEIIDGYDEELKEHFEEWNKLIENFPDDVKKLLEKWLLDGTLEELINETLLEMKRDIDEPKSSLNLSTILSFQKNTSGFCVPQGSCNVKSNIIMLLNDYDNGVESENILLQEISSITGETIREKVLRLGHGNGITYVNDTNKLLVVAGFILGNENKYIIEVDYNTLEITNNYSTEYNLTSIGYDQIKKKLWAKSDKKIIELNLNDFSVKKIFYINTNSIGQDLCVVNDYIYIPLSNPESLMILNDKGKLISQYVIPRYNNDNCYINELESIGYLGNNIFYLITFAFSSLSKKTTEITIHSLNLINGMNNNRQSFSNYPNSRINYYVDSKYKGFDSDGSIEKPFKNLNQCFLNTSNTSYMYVIEMTKGVYEFSEISLTNVNIEIRGNNSIIRNFYLNRIEKLTLKDCEITNENSRYCLSLDNISNVYLDNVILNSNVYDRSLRVINCNLSINNSKINSGIYSDNSIIKFTNNSISDSFSLSLSNNSILYYDDFNLQSLLILGKAKAFNISFPFNFIILNNEDELNVNLKLIRDIDVNFRINDKYIDLVKINCNDLTKEIYINDDLDKYKINFKLIVDENYILKNIEFELITKYYFDNDSKEFKKEEFKTFDTNLPYIYNIKFNLI